MKPVIIKPSSGWKTVNIRELVAYRDLLYFLVVRGIKAKYAQSVLGVGWAIIQPVSQTLIFTLVFGELAGLSSEGVPYILFSYLAMLPWNYFANILTESSNSLVENKNMINKVYFPRIVLPLASVFSKLLDFIIGLVVLIGLLFYYQIPPNIKMLIFPLLILMLIVNSLGIGMILSAMSIQYRDIQYAMTFLVRILMYTAPVVYSISIIPEKYVSLYSLNPMVGVIEGMRAAFIDSKPIPWEFIINGSAVSVIIFILGLFYFKRMEKRFADVA